jgi:hypothetical protein
VTQRIVGLGSGEGTPVTRFGQTYTIPPNVSMVDDVESDIAVQTFASREAFSDHMAAAADVSASAWGFDGEFAFTYDSISQGSQTLCFGLVEANSSLWNASVESLQEGALDPDFASDMAALPASFDPLGDPDGALLFADFFAKYGTHVIATSTAGGQLRYAVTVSSASKFDETTAHANMQLEYDAVYVDASASATADWKRMDQSWIASRQAQLHVRGGSPSVLAGAVPPDDPDQPVNYAGLVASWAESVGAEPSVIAIRLQPLSHLAATDRVHVLDEALYAYLNQSASGNSTVIVTLPAWVYGPTSSRLAIGDLSLSPPHVPTTANAPMSWIAMSARNGAVQFNENCLSGDPDDLDALITQAQDAAGDEDWWIVAVLTALRAPPSQLALDWLAACGIDVGDLFLDNAYPQWPTQLVAVGRTNNAPFQGVYDACIRPQAPYSANVPRQYAVQASIPLFAQQMS